MCLAFLHFLAVENQFVALDLSILDGQALGATELAELFGVQVVHQKRLVLVLVAEGRNYFGAFHNAG